MKNKVLRFLKTYGSWVLSGMLLIFSFPPTGIPFLGFLALIPAIYRSYKDNLTSTLIGSSILSILFWSITVDWFISFHPLALVGIIFGLYFYTVIPFLIFSSISKNFKEDGILTFPFIWVGFEYLRSNGFWSLPIIYLAHTQYHFAITKNKILEILNGAIPSLAQIFGVFGVSFVVALFNSLILIFVIKLRKTKTLSNIARLKQSYPLVTVILITLIGIILFISSKSAYENSQGETIEAALLQPNFSPWEKLFARDFGKLEDVISMYREGAKNSDIVIPCESILRDPVNVYYNFGDPFGIKAMNIGKELKKPIILTYPHRQTVLSNTTIIRNGKTLTIVQEITLYYNSAVFFDKNGNKITRYDKVHTVPFGEWTPFAEYIPYLRETINAIVGGDLTPGKEFMVIPVEIKPNVIVNIAPIICFEDLYPYITKILKKKKATLLVNMTNDGWANSIRSQWQHLIGAMYRSIETGLPMVRATNTGRTALILPYGKIISTIDDFKKGIMIAKIKLVSLETHFYKWGDIFFIIFLLVGNTLIFFYPLITSVFRKILFRA